MFKLNITGETRYSEIPQANPLRWRLMYLEEDGETLTSQSGLIKCKDFFNDVVAFMKAGREFSMYSFKNNIKYNTSGVYLHLTEVAKPQQFCDNINAGINFKLCEQLGVVITPHIVGKTDVVIYIPLELWGNTYRISLVTMLIRVCNNNISFDSWESLFGATSPLCTLETAFDVRVRAFTHEHGFILPEHVSHLWAFPGYGISSDTPKTLTNNMIHNNGAASWTQAIAATGVAA